MGPTEKLFNAIVSGDRATVTRLCAEEGFDIDRRDHVGRTPLQVAILSKSTEIACDLIDAGARMTNRLVDGRTALHVAAQLDLPAVVRKLLERSAVNDEKAKAEEEEKKRAAEAKDAEKMDVDDEEGDKSADEDDEDEDGHDSSEDDWSSDDEEKSAKEKKADDSLLPEDEEDIPDVFDVNVPDWDLRFTPLQYATVFGSLGAIDELLAAGADPKQVTKLDAYWAKPFHVLTLASLTRDPSTASEAAKRLVAAGATSSQADDFVFTIFHRIVCTGRAELVEALLRNDPSAKAVIDAPHVSGSLEMVHPVVSAITRRNYSALAVLLAHGAKYSFSEEDFTDAKKLR